VIATIILSAVVIAVGGAIWSYAQGAATSIANDYVNGTLSLLDEVLERFIVEHVTNSSGGITLNVTVCNYGEPDIIVDIYAEVSGGVSNSTLGTSITSSSLVHIPISFQSSHLQSGDVVSIKVHSRRQNNAYYVYYVP
jgi:hypothetical protein